MRENISRLPVAISYIFGGVATWVIGNFLAGDNPFSQRPRDIRVEEGYVKPSNIEIKLEDLDLNGKNETILRVDATDYLFKYDGNKNPFLVKYDIEPGKEIPPKIVLKK